MSKFYRIVLLILALIFLSTYTPGELKFISKKKNNFFKIENIQIINNNLVEKNEIIKKLNHIYKKNILFVKSDDFKNPLKLINFLDKIEVKKKYPNTIIIKVTETKPIAILFKKDQKYFLDSSSNLVLANKNIFNDYLPNIFGDGAEINFIKFFNYLRENNFPIEKIKNYYYFQIGRWDLQLFNNQIIKFPPDLTDEILKQTIELLSRSDFKNYNIIDLRIHGKMVVE